MNANKEKLIENETVLRWIGNKMNGEQSRRTGGLVKDCCNANVRNRNVKRNV
jgi:hypothetical protein